MKFILCLALILTALPALAADPVYVQRYDTPEKAQDTAPVTPAAQGIKAYANSYYQNCLKQEHPILRGDDLALLCACTSAKFSENMTPAQVQVMNTNTPEGLYQRNRVLMFVYAPCIEFPTRALIMSQCVSDKKAAGTMRYPRETCACLADGVAADVKKDAPAIIKSAIETNPKNLDPLGLLMNSNAFETRMRYHTATCIQRHELGFK